MGRLSCLLLVVFCVGVATVRGDDPWFPDPFKWDSPPPADSPPPPLYPTPTPDTPSPYYDAPPYMSGPPPVAGPSYFESDPPTEAPGPSTWLSCGLWAKNTDAWPSPWTADTPIQDALGGDAVKVYGHISMLDGILSKGDDGYSNLLKEGITAILNGAGSHFTFKEEEIKKSFSLNTALSSEASAADQAKLFHAANEVYTFSP